MFNRWVEEGLLDVLEKNGVGSVVFSPLFQGLLTDKYLNGIPEGSRAAKSHGFLQASQITEDKIKKVKALNQIAASRGQKMSQLALSWVLRDPRVTSVIIGASKVSQIEDAVEIVNQPKLSSEELKKIESILNS
jgi:L-glyceraldehyde 3-phosphate reductase